MKRLLVIGIGNELRGDDGIGPIAVSSLLGSKEETFADFLSTLQLLPEHAEKIKDYESVLLVDASLELSAGEMRLQKISKQTLEPSSLHEVSPQAVLALTKAVYGTEVPTYLMEIGVEQIEHSDRLSKTLANSLPKIRLEIGKWLASH